MGRPYLRMQSHKLSLEVGGLRETLHEIVVALDTLESEVFKEPHS